MNTQLKKSVGLCIAVLVASVALWGCEKSGGDQFVGTWSAQQGNIRIEKSGDLYLIKDVKANAPYVYCPSGASYISGQLICTAGGAVIGYDAKNDKLLMTVGPFHETVSRVN